MFGLIFGGGSFRWLVEKLPGFASPTGRWYVSSGLSWRWPFGPKSSRCEMFGTIFGGGSFRWLVENIAGVCKPQRGVRMSAQGIALGI